jgi:hypothetical protein
VALVIEVFAEKFQSRLALVVRQLEQDSGE